MSSAQTPSPIPTPHEALGTVMRDGSAFYTFVTDCAGIQLFRRNSEMFLVLERKLYPWHSGIRVRHKGSALGCNVFQVHDTKMDDLVRELGSFRVVTFTEHSRLWQQRLKDNASL